MPDKFTPADLELFVDLQRAAHSVGVSPYLIGAGAIQLGPSLGWEVRLDRRTRDWDFAVRVESWEQFEALAVALTAGTGHFTRAPEPHRFDHRLGGTLDVIPYGGLENPPGTLHWPGGIEMDTAGFGVLDRHHCVATVATTTLMVATLPALLGLKLLAYRHRRPGIGRDIVDVAGILRDIEGTIAKERIIAEALGRLDSGDVGLGEVDSYLLGLDVGRAFAERECGVMRELLDEIDSARPTLLSDAARGTSRERGTEVIKARFGALRYGLLDH